MFGKKKKKVPVWHKTESNQATILTYMHAVLSSAAQEALAFLCFSECTVTDSKCVNLALCMMCLEVFLLDLS